MFIPNVEFEKTFVLNPNYYVEIDIPTQHWFVALNNYGVLISVKIYIFVVILEPIIHHN